MLGNVGDAEQLEVVMFRHAGVGLLVPKTLSELMEQWNRLSCRNDQAALFRSDRPGLAVQFEVTA